MQAVSIIVGYPEWTATWVSALLKTGWKQESDKLLRKQTNGYDLFFKQTPENMAQYGIMATRPQGPVTWTQLKPFSVAEAWSILFPRPKQLPEGCTVSIYTLKNIEFDLLDSGWVDVDGVFDTDTLCVMESENASYVGQRTKSGCYWILDDTAPTPTDQYLNRLTSLGLPVSVPEGVAM